MKKRDISKLITEQRNENSIRIDDKSTEEIIEIFNMEDQKAVKAVIKEKKNIAKAAELIVESFRKKGRLIYVGAGTSGRLGVVDAAECPPTFGVERDMVQGIIAGGYEALIRSIERAEDYPDEGVLAVQGRNVNHKDTVVGISTSGSASFVIGALEEAHGLGANTIFIMCVPPPEDMPFVDVFITPIVGPEIIAGSTRLKSGTATKLVLNMLSTISMIKLGKVYDNMMVDVQVWNAKLVERAKRLISHIGQVDYDRAAEILEDAEGNVKVAIVMARMGISYEDAVKLLDEKNGFLRKALEG
ncbi:N-acetylmuramic acid 6-phosphate etherase [Candidatus Poribacteria bacterium]|nr:N-acetylmuramic acid 6-phosphate etherase [Candidatus Poribacteria bacterium]